MVLAQPKTIARLVASTVGIRFDVRALNTSLAGPASVERLARTYLFELTDPGNARRVALGSENCISLTVTRDTSTETMAMRLRRFRERLISVSTQTTCQPVTGKNRSRPFLLCRHRVLDLAVLGIDHSRDQTARCN